MTTPTTPANALDVSDIRDEINPGDGSGIQQDIGANNSVRQLTGSAAKSKQGAEILFSDLSNKVAFSEIYTPSTTNTQGGIAVVGSPITAEITLQANSDMFDPTLTWTYTIDNGSSDVSCLPFCPSVLRLLCCIVSALLYCVCSAVSCLPFCIASALMYHVYPSVLRLL